jgi:ribosomal protein S18 acetylase RimI-like enzyme
MILVYAERSQIDEAASVLVDALSGDPLFVALFPEPERRRLLSLGMLASLSVQAPMGEVLLAIEEGAIRGAVIARPPFAPPVAIWRAVGAYFSSTFRYPFSSQALQLDAARLIDEHRLRSPHWYVQTIGVAPAHQRRGIGELLLRPILDRAAAERRPVQLHSWNERNLSFYRRLGFEASVPIRSERLPPVVALVRPPHPRGMAGD